MAELSPLIAEILQGGGEVILTITGRSMLPLLRDRRDKVCLVHPREQPLRQYDIPLYQRTDGSFVLHRIIAVGPAGYAVCGDNQEVREYPVLPSQVIGVAKGFWRDGNYTACSDFWYRLYSRLWVVLIPLRRLSRRGKRFFGRGVRRLAGRL